MRVPRPRGRLAVLAVAVLAAAVAVPASSAAGCPGVTRLKDRWTRIAPPEFPAGGAAIRTYDVARELDGTLVATNGTAIATSDDGGCSWSNGKLPAATPVALPGIPLGDGGLVNATVTQVRLGEIGGVWAIGATTVVSSGVPVAQPRVLVSPDGATFDQRVSDLPPVGVPLSIRPYDARTATLLYHQTAPQDDYAVYTTTDGGGTWKALWTGLPPLVDLVVSNVGIWAWDAATLYHAAGAAAPVAVAGVPPGVQTVDVVSNLMTGRTTVTAYPRTGGARYVSTDGGPFVARPAPEGVRSVTHGAVDGTVIVNSDEANVVVEPGPTRPKGDLDYSPQDVNVYDVKASWTGSVDSFPVYAMHPLALYRRTVDYQPPPPPPPVDVEVHPVKPVRRVPNVRPSNPVIQLKPDEKRTVPFVVSLPPVPTPLDVFFMTDSTGSMDTTIGSVQESVQQIVDNLSASGVDLHFGVADFRDWPEQPGDSETYPYKLRRKAGPIGEELEGALESIQTGGGTTDGDDAALEAIYQATTGAGRRDPLPGSPRGQMLPAGLDAGFRDDALKVILSVSDDEMRAGFPNPTRPDYPGPTMQTVIAALKAADVHLVGIRVGDSKPLRADYERLAAGSGTVAPPAGTDCDGDGDADLSAGAPLVCDFNPGTDSIASAFISLLGGIRDFQNVRVRVGDPSGVARSLSDTDYGSLDVKASHTFKVPVEFTCGRAQYGTESQVTIDAVVRGATVVGTTATVRCGAPPPPPIVRRPPPPREPPLPDPPVPPPAHLVAAVAFAPAPPAQPVTNINPNANPNPNPNPNAGAATEQEQQGQLALAENDVPPGEEELAFSARPAPVPPTPVTAWLAAAAVTAAAAYGFHLSRRTSPALAYRPREHR